MTGRRALANNSVVQTNSIGNIDTIQCISGSSVANVGQVLGPSGQDIANSNLDPFEVTIGGANNPGHVEMSLAAGRLVSSDWIGVYTCTLPDESGATQTMFFGIYRSGTYMTLYSRMEGMVFGQKLKMLILAQKGHHRKEHLKSSRMTQISAS